MSVIRKAWANPTVRDVALAGLAAFVAGASVYFKAPALVPVYLALRAAVSAWIEREKVPPTS